MSKIDKIGRGLVFATWIGMAGYGGCKNVQNDPALAEEILRDKTSFTDIVVDQKTRFIGCGLGWGVGGGLANNFTAVSENGEKVEGCVGYGYFTPHDKKPVIQTSYIEPEVQ